jgi:membrane-bound lytic murein transglycosylase B
MPRRFHRALPGLIGLIGLLLCAACVPAATAAAHKRPHRAAAPAAPAYGDQADVQAFAAEVAVHRGLPREWIASQLAQARRVEAVRKAIMPPPAGTAKNWAAYRERFIEPRRIEAGVAFWRDHAAWLEQAEHRWGVPAAVVVGIIGVETFYGRLTGHFRSLDALATLAFDFPPGRKDRSAFFRGELEEFFVFCAREGADPQQVKGSYAGAIGLPQFMPGSINRQAIDFDGDGHIDLLASAADAVGSVANYLAGAGWQRGLPVTYEVAVPVSSADRAALLAPDIVPSFSAAQFAERGAVLAEAGRAFDGALALVELQNGPLAPSHVAGTRNFYVLTRYNQSSYYAMAVIALGEAVAAQRAEAAR